LKKKKYHIKRHCNICCEDPTIIAFGFCVHSRPLREAAELAPQIKQLDLCN
jgi:hypothetical protein